MKKFKYMILHVIIALSLLFFIGGCSSGGGGGSDGDDGLTYSGLTGEAEINELNAEDISGGAFGAGLIGDGMTGLSSSLDQSSNEHFVGEFRTVKVPQILSDSLNLIDFTAPTAGATQAFLDTTLENTEKGNCGGKMSYSVEAEDLDGTFSGRIKYSAYCNDGTEINGSAYFEVKMDLETLETDDPKPLEAYWSFERLSGGGLTLDGEIEIDFKESGCKVIINACSQYPGSEKVYWIDKYRITIDEVDENQDEKTDYELIKISGKFYHPDYGYVTLSTPEEEPFLLNYEGQIRDEWPTSGTLVVEGAIVPGANKSKARIVADDNQKCTVEADIDGDDEYNDMDPVTKDWDAI